MLLQANPLGLGLVFCSRDEMTFCKEMDCCQKCQILTCEETYSMQSSNFDSIGIKPSLFTDKVGEFSFCREKEKLICFPQTNPPSSGSVIKILSFICGATAARNVSISIWSQAKRKENLWDRLQRFYFSKKWEKKEATNVLSAPHVTF